jgi:hypothetical protein
MSEREYFLKWHAYFQEKHAFVVRILNAVATSVTNDRRRFANALFMRAGMTGNSMLLLCELELRNGEQHRPSLLDESSLATLARALFETVIMLM